MVRSLIGFALDLYMWVLVARMILSWVEALRPGWTPQGPLLVIANAIYALTDPPLKALEKVFRPVDLGGLRLSTSFMALLLGIYLLQWLNRSFVPF